MTGSSDGRRFLTTRWSQVLRAGEGSGPGSRQALEALCGTYWYPLYGYVRRSGFPPDEAADLTQEFFARLLERRVVEAADPGRGRFRSYLLAALRHFLVNQRAERSALKRGGGRPPIRFDARTAEERFALEPADPHTPERSFARSWALTLLEGVLGRLGSDYEAAGKGELFAALRTALTADPKIAPHRELGQQLGLSEGAVKVALHRLRCRYRELLRAEIAETVAEPEDVEDEIRGLFEALGP